MEVIQSNGYYYLIHKTTGQTWKSRYVVKEEAEAVADKINKSWVHDPALEKFELAQGLIFLDYIKDELCRTIGPYFRRIA